MALKLKALGLGLIATLAIGGFLAMNAPAETGGHFTSENAHTELKGEQATTLTFIEPAVGVELSCKNAAFFGTVSTTTVTEFTLIPVYSECSSPFFGGAIITMHECDYIFTIGKKSTVDNTFHLTCPNGKQVEIDQTSPFGTCVITLKPQTPIGGGIAYTTGGSGKTHELLLDVTWSSVHVERHGGFCGTLKTTTSGTELKGTITFRGFNTAGEQVGITATGSEG